MAFHKIISKRLFNDVQRSAKSNISPISSPSRAVISLLRESLNSPVCREKGFFQRFLHRRALDRSATTKLPDFLSLPVGDKIRESLRRGDIVDDRLRLIRPPEAAGESPLGLSASDARKILRLAQMEKLKSKLREISENSIPYSEFSRICIEGCDNEEQGVELAKMLDQSGNVIVLGNVVFLRPEQVVCVTILLFSN